MAWIKRNLALVIGIAVSIVMLGGAGFYLVSNYNDDFDRDEELAKLKGELDQLRQDTFPSEANIGAVQTNVMEVLKFTTEAERILASEPPKPINVSLSVHLPRVIDELRRDATNASVEIPPKYDFTLGEVSKMAGIPRYATEALTLRVAELKTICDVLFKARVRAIESIQRVPAFADEPKGPDLLLDRVEQTNSLAPGVTMTTIPYRVVFRGFSGDLGTVLNTFSGTKDFFVVRQVDVESAVGGVGAGGIANPNLMNPGMMQPGVFGGPGPGAAPSMGGPGMATPGVAPNPPPGGVRPPATKGVGGLGALPPVPKSTLVKVLDEQPLRVTLLLDVIKVTRKAVPPTPAPAAVQPTN
ncbi:MAG: hypothetical protein B9S33_09890 [Pedosphaera sp. Tous-C6FEB]|nr:MAG: hypothetical protein B9S33_09890 [Pedosphaera sp. Tous-C6FEB]